MLAGRLSITSGQNPRVKAALALQGRRDRDREGLFLVEGYRETLRALQNGVEVVQLFFSRTLFLGENEPALLDLAEARGARLFELAPSVFEKLSYRDRPDGILAVARQWDSSWERLLSQKEPPLLVVAEAIEKPGNLGTILRSADAVKADGVIVCDPATDIYNPNVVRASTGTLFTLPVIQKEGEETLRYLKGRGIKVVAATPHAELEYTEADLSAPIAIAVGTEQLGLSSLWMEQADIQVRIPMRGVADSLNVATATTLLLYEALRQRCS